MARYGDGFKKRAVARLLPPESASAEELSRQLGVRQETLERWLHEALEQPEGRRSWTAAARFEAVLATASLDEAGKSAWCRANGVYPQELAAWRDSATLALTDPEEAADRSGNKAARRRIKSLERELRRKDKALAEAAALLVLSKKLRGVLPNGRGRMIVLEDRLQIARDIEDTYRAGARLAQACEVVGIDVRTLQRWKRDSGFTRGDKRPDAIRPMPEHALSAAERAQVLQVANEPRFADMPPARIVPALADEGTYLASESTFSRVLRSEGQAKHRGRAKRPNKRRPPTTHIATGPRQVWSWDMTYLPTTVTGAWFYLYLILDVYSRKVVGFEVHATDDSAHAVDVVRRAALGENLASGFTRPVLHSDNGATLKATTVVAMLRWLGIDTSYSRPRVSNDNAYVESFFRTAKYAPGFPARGFQSLEEARRWASQFVYWYNHEHRHSGIRYVTPAQRHAGEDSVVLAGRHAVYTEARARHPGRWSKSTRNWTPIGAVALNPERESIVNCAMQQCKENIQAA
ncbi:MAG: IS3 family transposase [Pontimonas sp.]